MFLFRFTLFRVRNLHFMRRNIHKLRKSLHTVNHKRIITKIYSCETCKAYLIRWNVVQHDSPCNWANGGVFEIDNESTTSHNKQHTTQTIPFFSPPPFCANGKPFWFLLHFSHSPYLRIQQCWPILDSCLRTNPLANCPALNVPTSSSLLLFLVTEKYFKQKCINWMSEKLKYILEMHCVRLIRSLPTNTSSIHFHAVLVNNHICSEMKRLLLATAARRSEHDEMFTI